MAYPIYPLDKLPYPVRDNFTSQYGTPFKQVKMDDGHSRPRRRWELQTITPVITWRFTTWDKLAFFEAFLKYDVAQASGWFTMPMFPGDVLRNIRITKYPTIVFDESTQAWQASAQVEYLRTAPTGFARPTTLPLFPASLPEPERSGYQITQDETFTRSNLTEGLESQRARWNQQVATFTVVFLLDAAQYAIWDAFVHDQLLGGLAPFKGYFANGLGDTLTRIQFVETPVVSPNGAAYQVSATCMSQDIPAMSEFDYRGYSKFSLSDTYSFTEVIMSKLGNIKSDQYGYADVVNFKITKVLTDSHTLVASEPTIVSQFARTLPDSYALVDARVVMFAPAPFADTIRFSSIGSICKNLYISPDYIQAGYYADCTAFSVETQGYESFGYGEAYSFVSRYNRTIADPLTHVASGAVSNAQYITLDYIEYTYSNDTILSF